MRSRVLALLGCLVLGGCSSAAAVAPDVDAGGADSGSDAIADVDASAPASIRAIVDARYPVELYAALESAKRDVWVVHFEMNGDSAGDGFTDRLVNLAKKGVTVHVVLEDSVAANAARIPQLTAAGASAKLDLASRYTHAKLVVIDDEIAILGSTNGSFMSMFQNHEADLVIERSPLVGYFRKYAEAVWNAPGSPVVLPTVSAPEGTAYSDGGYVAQVRPLVTAAKRRILLVVYGMNADARYPDSDIFALIGLMGDAKARGADVRVILDYSAYAGPEGGTNVVNLASAKVLASKGIDVRFDPPDTITHAKVLVVDDEVVLGSNNWGYGGFTLYHEVGVRTAVPKAVEDLAAYFESIWAKSSVPPI